MTSSSASAPGVPLKVTLPCSISGTPGALAEDVVISRAYLGSAKA